MNTVAGKLLPLIFLLSCGAKKEKEATNNQLVSSAAATRDVGSFFPVTDYLSGQIMLIKKGSINPIFYTKTGERTDSCWIRMEEIDSVLQDFMQPRIDSLQLAPYFKESKFEDASLQLITLSYDAGSNLPKEVPWSHWDIYIDPETGEVKRIYMVKYLPENRMQQLHFNAGECWKITNMITGKSTQVVNEKKLLLKYDSQ